MAPKITLHFIPIPGSRADRLFWILEELGLEYNVQAHLQQGPTSPSFKEVSVLGKTPALEVDGRILTETGFIVQYLLKNFPKAGLEATPSDDSVHWSFFSEGTLMLHLQPGRVLGFAAGALPKKPGVSAEEGKGMAALYNWFSSVWVGKNVPLQLQCVEDFLAQNPNFSGSELIGSGDIMMGYPLNYLATGTIMGEYSVGPATRKWVAGIRARPAWQRAMERQDKERQVQSKPKM